MGGWKYEDRMPALAMVSLQFVYATINLVNREAFVKGTSPMVFVFYRLVAATLVTFPIAFFTRNKSNESSIGKRGFLLMFVTAFIGLALCQNLFNAGLFMASASTASATSNLIPGITFLIAAILGLEKVDMKRLSSIAKILGTIICVGGAVSMALLKGTKLLNTPLPLDNFPLLQSLKLDQKWLLGCILLFASACCWSIWLILQVPLTACFPNHFALSAWMCFLAMVQAGAIAWFFEPHPKAWIMHSNLEVTAILFSGVFGSGVQYFVQAWCISRKGPLFSAVFSPLSTVITTTLASILIHEQVYIGTLLGAIAVITGLYVVLWGKAEEMKNESNHPEQGIDATNKDNANCNPDLESPLLQDDQST